MSEAPELSEAEALAAEHALGVLSAPERAEAEARAARDPAFAAEVAAWRARLEPMAGAAAPIAAPAQLWARIVRSLPANDNVLARRLRFWRASALGGFGLAAASLAAMVAVVANPPVVERTRILPPQGEVMQASLMSRGERVQPLFVAAYDPDRQALIVTSLVPPAADPLHVHELWLIAGRGPPTSLGFIEPGKSKMIRMPAPMSGRVGEGVALAVSVEAPGGSRDPNGPTGPIAAMGRLSRL